ncbi:hypothetical protein [Oceanibaculum nanhaiense]|uniref:hypothetical protein n=1 Tax=Oceanibaculum nanhaiense TaxID=1909734 RepID=UPI0015943DA2|nr:hypothetical protein [Oceanibaculum nanhaiense]
MPRGVRATENEIAFAVLQIAASQPNGVATFPRMKRDVPNYINLSDEDRQRSITRPNEEIWEQLIRNIKSHYQTQGNYICEGYLEHVPKSGYRITDEGRRYLKSRS